MVVHVVIKIENGVVVNTNVFNHRADAELYAMGLGRESGVNVFMFDELEEALAEHGDGTTISISDEPVHSDGCGEDIVMNKWDIHTATLVGEEGNGDPIEVEVVLGAYGIRIEFAEEGNDKCVMLDYFNNKLSVKVWADNDNEDFTHEIPLS